MPWLFILLLFVIAVIALYHYFTRNFNYWICRNAVGPKPVPLFGNMLESALRRKFVGSVFKKVYEEFPNEKIVGVYRMTTPALLVRDLDIVKHIMIKDFNQFMDRGIEFNKKDLGANLFHADGNTWQVLRTTFSPLFTSGKLKNMVYLLSERAIKFSNYVDHMVNKDTEQDVYMLIQLYTLMTISACAFGLDIHIGDSQVELLKSFDKNIFTVSYLSELDMMYPGILKKLNLSIFGPVKYYFENLVKTVIKERNGKPSGRKDFMDLILELRQQSEVARINRNDETKDVQLQITDDVIAAQAFIFYGAGYETSATTMSMMLYYLARHQDIQDKLIAEVDKVLQKYDGKITYDSINEMSYMDAVFSETLRLHPIVDPLQRNAQSDYKIPGTDVMVKKGQIVLISISGIHYDPKYYPNPEKFDPDRFTVENMANLHPSAYLPFGIGPRNCIGMRFAKLQSRVCITKLLSKYRVEPSKNTPAFIDPNPRRLIMAPRTGIPLNIILR